MKQGQLPGNYTAPVMSYNNYFRLSQFVNKCDYIIAKMGQAVIFYRGRFTAQIITSLVRNDDPVALFGKKSCLLFPSVPKLRETMQKNDVGASLITGFD